MTWQEICEDPVVAKLPYRVESNEWGEIVVRPMLGMRHVLRRGMMMGLLDRLLRGGAVLPSCPLQTSKGVKVIDLAWMSDERIARQPSPDSPATLAPEICVGMTAPSNQRGEIEERMRLCFGRGALECWTCDQEGGLVFYNPAGLLACSALCPDFPQEVVLSRPEAK